MRALADAVPSLDVLVNNAGGAFDAATVEDADVDLWAQMYDVNVIGLVRVTQALLPALRADGGGLVVNMGSTAGRVAYEGGGGYTAAKHGVKVITQTLRLELVAEPLRFTEIAPGMVRTEEFALTASRATRRSGTRSTTESPSPWSPRTSPRPCAGSPRCRRTSTSTRSSSARAPRPPSTRCTARSEPQRRLKTVPRLFGGGSKGLSAKQLAR